MPKLCVIPGDGIGREVIPAAVQVLRAVIPDLETIEAEAGWECFQNHGVSVLPETLQTVRECGAALFGAVSSPARKVEGYRSAAVSLRRELDLYGNIRPVKSLPVVSTRKDVDMIIVRENTEGLYVGEEHSDGETATALRRITRKASRRIAERAVSLARAGKRGRITIVHKANILPLTDGLFRDTVRQVVEEAIAQGLALQVDELLVDTAALRMVTEPQRFDILVTTNLFGDILSDEAAAWTGGIGLAASINLGDTLAIAEPVHGSAPDIAGKGIANPIAAILSAALLPRYVWNMEAPARRIETAVNRFLSEGGLEKSYRTEAITAEIIENLERSVK